MPCDDDLINKSHTCKTTLISKYLKSDDLKFKDLTINQVSDHTKDEG